jgi:hypothetical protein
MHHLEKKEPRFQCCPWARACDPWWLPHQRRQVLNATLSSSSRARGSHSGTCLFWNRLTSYSLSTEPTRRPWPNWKKWAWPCKKILPICVVLACHTGWRSPLTRRGEASVVAQREADTREQVGNAKAKVSSLQEALAAKAEEMTTLQEHEEGSK